MNTTLILTLDLVLTILLIWCLTKLKTPASTIGLFGGACVAWIAFLVWVFDGHRIISNDIGGIAFFAIILVGAAIVTGLFFITPVGDGFKRGGHEWLLMPQGMRAFFGATFLIQGIGGTMPPAFAIADGATHIAAAVLSLWTAWMLSKGYLDVRALWFTNLFGLLDIVVVAAGIAFVLLPVIGPYHNIMYAAFFAAPIFISLHLLSLSRLLGRGTATAV